VKILIVNAYLRNSGDSALLSALIKQLRVEWPFADITIASRERSDKYHEFEGCKNIGSIRLYTEERHIKRIRRILRKIFVDIVVRIWGHLHIHLRTILTAHLPYQMRIELQTIEETDLVISTGGGYINGVNSIGGNLNIKYVLMPLMLAKKIGKTTIFGPQSYGPLANGYQRRLVKRALNISDAVLVREDNSYELLLSIGVNEHLLIRSVDSGFAFDTDIINNDTSSKKSGIKIGITARLWFTPTRQHKYEKALADFTVQANKDYKATVSLVPQVTSDLYSEDDDRIVERRIAKLVRKREKGRVDLIDKKLSHHELKEIYSGLDFTVGTRFHSVIFSLTSYVPAIAIEYEHKTSGIMKDLGLERWVLKIDEVSTDRLNEMFTQLFKEREKYLAHLRKVLPDYIEKANNAGKLIKRIYDERLSDAADPLIR
jgi:colanic acid/amylovoran biosynthesis protein